MAHTTKSAGSPKPRKPRKVSKEDRWDLRLYIAGRTKRAETALENLKRICRENLEGRYRVVVIDLLKTPRLARGDQIVAVPTLVRNLPAPVRRIIGDLSNTEQVLIGLNLKAR